VKQSAYATPEAGKRSVYSLPFSYEVDVPSVLVCAQSVQISQKRAFYLLQCGYMFDIDRSIRYNMAVFRQNRLSVHMLRESGKTAVIVCLPPDQRDAKESQNNGEGNNGNAP
jgi:hypothetical protein